MPARMTHYLFAQKVFDRLPEDGRPEPEAFAWGAQGPDFLFCHRFFPWMGGKSLKSWGNAIHSADPLKTLGALRDFLKDHGGEGYRDYAWGFFCHYALDSLSHPYINFLANELAGQRPEETPGTMHGEIESALDAIMLRRETGKLPSEGAWGKTFPRNEAVQRRIARLYRDMIFRAFDEDVSEDELYRATQDARFVFGCTTDRTGLKKRLFDVVEKGKPSFVSSHIVPMTERDDIDYANSLNNPWTAGEEERTESFFDLFDNAQDLALALIIGQKENALTDEKLALLTKNRPFG